MARGRMLCRAAPLRPPPAARAPWTRTTLAPWPEPGLNRCPNSHSRGMAPLRGTTNPGYALQPHTSAHGLQAALPPTSIHLAIALSINDAPKPMHTYAILALPFFCPGAASCRIIPYPSQLCVTVKKLYAFLHERHRCAPISLTACLPAFPAQRCPLTAKTNPNKCGRIPFYFFTTPWSFP